MLGPAPLFRVKDRFRAMLLMKAEPRHRAPAVGAVGAAVQSAAARAPRGVKFAVDVDPQVNMFEADWPVLASGSGATCTLLASRELAVAFPDAFPASPGTLSGDPPPSQSPTSSSSRGEEQEDVWEIVWEMRELLAAEHDTTSFNVGINAGEAAGQVVPHAHVHVIPRYPGDVSDPRGGVRWVIPGKAKCWD